MFSQGFCCFLLQYDIEFISEITIPTVAIGELVSVVCQYEVGEAALIKIPELKEYNPQVTDNTLYQTNNDFFERHEQSHLRHKAGLLMDGHRKRKTAAPATTKSNA